MNARVRAPSRRGWRRDTGFTLVEVLVTTAVTIVAFTGLATLQVLSLRAASSTQERSQATALAYDIVDRLRLNRGTSTLALSALGGGYDNATLCNANARNRYDSRICQFDAIADLTNTDAVTQDLKQWWQALESADLAHWYAGIQRTGDRFLVAVQWDDARAEGNGADADEAQASCLGGEMPVAMQEICVMTQL